MDTKYIVSEFEGKTMVLEVFAVLQIKHISFMEIETSTEMYAGEIVPVLVAVNRDDGIILLIDFERAIGKEFGSE